MAQSSRNGQGESVNTAISLDWDFVTGDCVNDSAHCGFCANAIEGGIGKRGFSADLYKGWKGRFTELRNLPYPVGVPFYVAECHADIFGVLRAPIGDQLDIFDFDAHYDHYPHEERFLSCGNWIAYAKRLYDARVMSRVYDGAKEADLEQFNTKLQQAYGNINLVFLCKSSPWTPEKLDKRFYELVGHISNETGGPPIFIGHRAPELAKEYKAYRKWA